MSTTNPTRADLGSNPSLRGDRPATTRLNPGTAYIDNHCPPPRETRTHTIISLVLNYSDCDTIMRAFSHNEAAWDPVRPEFRVRMRQRADRRMSCSPLARQDNRHATANRIPKHVHTGSDSETNGNECNSETGAFTSVTENVQV